MATKAETSTSFKDFIKIDFKSIQGKITLGFLSMGLISVLLASTTYFILQKEIKKHKEIVALHDATAEELLKRVPLEKEAEMLSLVGTSITWLLALMAFCAGIWLAYHLYTTILRNLKSTQNALQELTEGNLPAKLAETDDELNSIILNTNLLIENLQHVKHFSEEVGKGHFDSDIVVFKNEGELGKSLAQMRKSLRDVSEEDKIRNWSAEGIAKFANLLRQNTSSLEELSFQVISELVKYLKANQGALFLLNDKLEREPVLELKASYAYDRRKFQQKIIHLGEGLAGQIFLEKETLLLKEIPKDYLSISSGLGDSPPRSILVVPLKLNDNVTGVIEMASFTIFQPHDIALTEKIAESIASTVRNVRIAEDTNRLLQDSQESTEQLRAAEEEMRQNLEELQATQDQIMRQQAEIQKATESLELEKSMFSVLMEFLQDRLTYKDTECRVIRVNKAKAKRLNRTPEELIGTTDFDFFPKEHAEKAMREEKELMRVGEPVLDKLEKVNYDNGDVAFINTSRIPFKNNIDKLIGTFIISRDVTQQKIVEATIQNQDKMLKNLLEHLPMFSYKVDRNGLLKDLNVGNLGSATELILKRENQPFQEVCPEVSTAAAQNTTGEFAECDETVTTSTGAIKFKHFVMPDSIYKNAYWGFAVME